MDSTALHNIATFAYLFATFFYVAYLAFRTRAVGNIATGMAALGVLVHTAGKALRWVESYRMGIGHAPLSNMYESMSFFALCVMAAYQSGATWGVGGTAGPLGPWFAVFAGLGMIVGAIYLLYMVGAILPDLEIVEICHQAESQWAGVNCGVMDQFTSVYGRPGHAI